MNIKIPIILLLLFFSFSIKAQTTFQKTFGGSVNNYGYAVQQTNDGGYIISGSTSGSGVPTPLINLIKTNSLGDTLWTKTFEGSPGYSIVQSNDGGYAIAGTITGLGAGLNDVLLIKTDGSGNTSWIKTYGSVNKEGATCLEQTSDNGYIITGTAEQGIGAGLDDVYLVKTDSVGNNIWTKTYRGGNNDVGLFTTQTSDGGYIIAGISQSFYPVGGDIYLVKTNPLGDTLWTKIINGSYLDQAYYIEQTTDGGYIISGVSASFGPYKALLIKIGSTGNILWAKTYGNTNNELAKHAQQTTDGGYIISGYGDTGGGNYDIYLTKTDSLGNIQWCKTYGGPNVETGFSVKQTADGGFIVVGQTNSFGSGSYDIYLIKTDSGGNSNCNQNTVTPIVDPVTFPIAHFSATVLSGSITGAPVIMTGSGINTSSLCLITYISESASNTISSLSPNPFFYSAILKVNYELKNAELIIYDLLGRDIKIQTNITGTEITIKRDNLKAGVYFYKVMENNDLVTTGKFIAE